MSKVLVYHDVYGCETGCCGHVVQLDGDKCFELTHPDTKDEASHLEFAKQLVREVYGEEHVKDLDWENSIVVWE